MEIGLAIQGDPVSASSPIVHKSSENYRLVPLHIFLHKFTVNQFFPIYLLYLSLNLDTHVVLASSSYRPINMLLTFQEEGVGAEDWAGICGDLLLGLNRIAQKCCHVDFMPLTIFHNQKQKNKKRSTEKQKWRAKVNFQPKS